MKNERKRSVLVSALIIAASFCLCVLISTLIKTRGFLLGMTVLAVGSIFAFVYSSETALKSSRRAVLCAIMTALCVVGRFIPVFKPVAALTVLAGIYLGAESGFLVGALSALLSNVFFGHGPWTPYQMLGWGLIGFAAGLLSGPLRRSAKGRRVIICAFGAVSAVLYSLLMDVFSTLWYEETFSLAIYLATAFSALPHTLIYIFSNVVFILLLSPSFSRKLERVEKKYGI
ncbi:MAG: ECF transporter S component [Clostridia bacterium]|nr:ECF transporter S component [Clostridia bacterium]